VADRFSRLPGRFHLPPSFAARKRSVSYRMLTIGSSFARSGRALDLHSMTATRCTDVRQGTQSTRLTMVARRLRLFQHRRDSVWVNVREHHRQPGCKPCQKGRPSMARNQKGERRIARGNSLYRRASRPHAGRCKIARRCRVRWVASRAKEWVSPCRVRPTCFENLG